MQINYEQRLPNKSAKLRFPTDDEFAKRQRGRRLRVRQLGNGESETLPIDGSEAADLELFNALRLDVDSGDEFDEFDEFEAAEAVAQITRAEVVSIDDQHADGIAVVIDTPWGQREHVIKVPTRRQLASYRRSRARVKDGRFNVLELVINLDADKRLYDELKVSANGYEGDPPLFHVAVVTQAIDQYIQSLAAPHREDF